MQPTTIAKGEFQNTFAKHIGSACQKVDPLCPKSMFALLECLFLILMAFLLDCNVQ